MDALTPTPIPLLGLDFDDISLDETITRLLARSPEAHFAYVVTPNADHIVRLRRQPHLGPVYRRAMFCLLDSQLIAHCAHALRLPTPHVVTGADLTQALLDRLDGMQVSIIGLNPETFAALAVRYPRIHFRHHQPPMRLLHDQPAFDAACGFASSAQPAFTFIALGSPVQELLAAAIADRPDATGIGLCIGAALEFCAGTTPRAPLWMRRSGLEWLHRLIRDPPRLARRYLIDDPGILADLLIAAFRQTSR
jgi:N-acetylglucosaminyldiphosphoundecaprenol N-acetyl-beta-D-mannosaminyltransferase